MSDFIDQSNELPWFFGVVEDINDPKEMGRIRVRCFGFHTDIQQDLPTEDLPWSMVVNSVFSASMSGIGVSPTGILQGSWVIGIFRDGDLKQDPLVLGTIPSLSTDPKTESFRDPENVYPLKKFLNESDTNRSARTKEKIYQDTDVWKKKNSLRQDNVETAKPAFSGSRGNWSSLKLSDIIAPKYPNNKVTSTISGHILEVDDTENQERISNFHKSGTYNEITANGDETHVINGNEYSVVVSDKNVVVRGNVNLTVDADVRTLVKGDYHLEVEGNKTELIHGNSEEKVSGNHKELTEGNHEEEISGSHEESISGSKTSNTSGKVVYTGATINLN